MAGLPLPPEEDYNEDRRRLWIGNLDENITEFALLKLLQKYGTLEQFDFLYHRVGPDKGKPRGYCFATYKTTEEAHKAEKSLHGKVALKKKLIVKPAQGEKDFADCTKSESSAQIYPSQSRRQKQGQTSGVSSQIAALEAQLKSLERKQDTDISAFLPPGKNKLDSVPQNNSSSGYVGSTHYKGAEQKSRTVAQVSKRKNIQQSSQYNQKKPYSKHKH